MVKNSIKIFARLRPTKKPKACYESLEGGVLSLIVPKLESEGIVNNKKEQFLFKFNKVFDQSTKQDEVFTQVAEPVISNCLEGYNGTIFAYGQTGSGKTFTITGGAERYTDRGIIPRTLSHLYQQYQNCPQTVFTTHVSYLEIYNETGYDLLDPKHEASKLEELPKVTLYEDSDGVVHLKNLSTHLAANEEEALNWLFLGDTNRIIAETPMNMASTRSHCIFTIIMTAREVGSHTVRRAKLHLVDLAGSERVSKSGVGGTLLTEAKCINLSLHFLEQVIVALSEKARSHIPYRNSMMTSVLRDSLGGNCMTTMIATVSVDNRNLEETISTCRFAQRVGMVKNEAILNEELDPKLMVAKLKQEIFDLKQELALTSGEERKEELSEEDRIAVVKAVETFLSDESSDSRLELATPPDTRKIQLAYQLMKRKLHTALSSPSNRSATPTTPVDSEMVTRLQDRLRQRDEEINILLKMLKQERKKVAEYEAVGRGGGGRSVSPLMGTTTPIPLTNSPTDSGRGTATHRGGVMTTGVATPTSLTSVDTSEDRVILRAELSKARQETFDMYRREIGDTTLIDKHKHSLRAKYSQAKALGQEVNTSRVNINKLKSLLDKMKVQNELNQAAVIDVGEEERVREQIEREKYKFKGLCSQLKTLKAEIEHLQHLLEKARLQLQRDFEEWWTINSTSNAVNLPRINGSGGAVARQQPITSPPARPVKLLTGNSKTDEDIIAFYKARQKLMGQVASS